MSVLPTTSSTWREKALSRLGARGETSWPEAWREKALSRLGARRETSRPGARRERALSRLGARRETSRPEGSARNGVRRVGTRRETGLFRLGAGLIALRILDDTVLQPAPGTSVLDHPVSALVPLSVLALIAWAYPRIRAGAWRG